MKKNIKTKILAGALALASVISLAGCSQGGEEAGETGEGNFDTSRAITVVSREDGSGTRSAFIELLGIEEKNGDTKTDKTTKSALIANKTGVMLTNIQTDEYAIGYISMGSLSDDVKAVSIDGVKASSETVKDGSYVLSRPFVIAINEEKQSDLSKDFINFILSADGQKVVSESYVTIDDNAPAFAGTNPSGRIVVAGSSSVTPVMEKLAEAYKLVNPNGEIEIQQSDSTAGMMAVSSGTADIGMASRDLKDSEKETLTGINIALDAIAVIVNPENPVETLTSEQVYSIYVGESKNWSDIVSE